MPNSPVLYKVRKLEDEEVKTLNGLQYRYIQENQTVHPYKVIPKHIVDGNKDALEDILSMFSPVSLRINYANTKQMAKDCKIEAPYIFNSASDEGDYFRIVFVDFSADSEKIFLVPKAVYMEKYAETVRDYCAIYAEELNLSMDVFDIDSISQYLPSNLSIKPYCELKKDAIDKMVSLGYVSREDVQIDEEECLVFGIFEL